ncbi:MAG TPA: HXXEE domain-containing protein [Edaphocola sp.]|nr:HXXEE domain-containing protein [Edaphocola sp.]
MDFLRKHWYDIAGISGVMTLVVLLLCPPGMSDYQLLMWLSLVSLFFHQLEEYRIARTFPGMINRVMFNSDLPDRYPLNSHTAFVINVIIGWTLYFLAAIAGEQFVWLGMAAVLVSLGNIIAHTFVFNIKGKTLYNAGLATSWLLFAPSVFFFFKIIHEAHLATDTDYLIGIPLGILINIFGIFKLILWMADKNSPFIFKDKNLLPRDRKH